jgi:hypothetical protein
MKSWAGEEDTESAEWCVEVWVDKTWYYIGDRVRIYVGDKPFKDCQFFVQIVLFDLGYKTLYT